MSDVLIIFATTLQAHAGPKNYIQHRHVIKHLESLIYKCLLNNYK